MLARILVLGALFVAGVVAEPPEFTCFGGEGDNFDPDYDYGEECCEALRSDGDESEGRWVIFEPTSCNHGIDPVMEVILEAFGCRAHDHDGCRFCHKDCDKEDEEAELCYTCPDSTGDPSQVPTPAPTWSPSSSSAPTWSPTSSPTSVPTTGGGSPLPTPAPTTCDCEARMTDAQATVLTARGKAMTCDPSCSDPVDPVFGTLHCNYFGLGQTCRACSATCAASALATPSLVGYTDANGVECKPCDQI